MRDQYARSRLVCFCSWQCFCRYCCKVKTMARACNNVQGVTHDGADNGHRLDLPFVHYGSQQTDKDGTYLTTAGDRIWCAHVR